MRLIKVPGINALGLRGPEKAPDLILKEIEKNSDFENLGNGEIKIDSSNIEENNERIYENAKREFEKNSRVVFLGGDHSISFPILEALGDLKGFENCFLIVFDAHADCCKPGKEPTHEEWLRALVEIGWRTENIAIIGTRKIWGEEREFLKKNKIKVFSCDCNLESAADFISGKAKGMKTYISFDMDVCEPSLSPGVNYPEPNGLNNREFFCLAKRFFHISSLKGIDIVEICPEIDKKYDYRSVKLAAKLAEEFLKIENGKNKMFYRN